MTEMTVQELAGKMAAVLRERGRCRGEYEASDGKVCVRGAISVALNLPPGRGGLGIRAARLYWEVGEAIKARIPRRFSGPIDWNDAPDVVDDDVLRVLDEIAASS